MEVAVERCPESMPPRSNLLPPGYQRDSTACRKPIGRKDRMDTMVLAHDRSERLLFPAQGYLPRGTGVNAPFREIYALVFFETRYDTKTIY